LAGDIEFDERFRNVRPDPARWRIDAPPSSAIVDVVAGALQISIPPGARGSPPSSLRYLAPLSGPFSAQVDYALSAFPKPRTGWINVEIYIDGQDGQAAVIRTNHAEFGAGYSVWSEPPRGSRKGGTWSHLPAADTKGTLRIERTGTELGFWARPNKGLFRLLGTLDYGRSDIRRLEFRVTAPATESPIIVALTNIAVRTGRFLSPLPRPSPVDTLFGARSIGAALLVAAGVGKLLVWRMKLVSRPETSGGA
jgi:hypothetical protein